MKRILRYMDALNIISILSLIFLWVYYLSGTVLPTNKILGNFLAITGMIVPVAVFIFQLLLLLFRKIRRIPMDRMEIISLVFSCANFFILIIYLIII